MCHAAIGCCSMGCYTSGCPCQPRTYNVGRPSLANTLLDPSFLSLLYKALFTLPERHLHFSSQKGFNWRMLEIPISVCGKQTVNAVQADKTFARGSGVVCGADRKLQRGCWRGEWVWRKHGRSVCDRDRKGKKR